MENLWVQLIFWGRGLFGIDSKFCLELDCSTHNKRKSIVRLYLVYIEI